MPRPYARGWWDGPFATEDEMTDPDTESVHLPEPCACDCPCPGVVFDPDEGICTACLHGYHTDDSE